MGFVHNLRAKVRAKRAAKAELARRPKVEALQAAIQRRDTRRQGDTFKPAFDATNAALRAEVGRS